MGRVPTLKGPTAAQRKEQSMMDKMRHLMSRLPKGTFAAGGGALGTAIGGPAGGAIGSAIGSGIATITGYGDYTVKSNSILRGGYSNDLERSPIDDLPQFVRGAHTVNVKHREYFGDLLVPENPTQFNNSGYVIQPSNTQLFPWLARIARQYQQYRIRGMVVEFKSNTTDYAAAGPLGSVGIATNYNVADAKFDTLVEFQNTEFAVVAKPSRNILHAIECHPSIGRGEWLYVRDIGNEDPGTVQDPRFNDFGLLQICTSGLPGTAGQKLGQLWVSYDIEFAKPVLGSTDPGPTPPGPVLKPGVLVTSTPDTGVLESTSNSALLSRYWTEPWTAPTANTVTPLFQNSTVDESTGNISADVIALSSTTNSFDIKRPGKYYLIYRLSVQNGSGSNHIISPADPAMIDINVVNNNAASSDLVTVNSIVPHAVTGAQSTTAMYVVALSYIINVSVADDLNTVTVTHPQFTTAGSSVLVASLRRRMDIEWLSTAPGSYM